MNKNTFAEQAAALKDRSEALETQYSDGVRAHWLTLSALQSALSELADGLAKLAGVNVETEPTKSLVAQMTDEIAQIEALIAPIDIERVRTDAGYAGSQLDRARAARASAEAVKGMSYAIVNLATTQAKFETARKARVEYVSPERKKQKFAVAKEAFCHTRGGNPVNIHKGMHCSIDHESDTGVNLGCGTWGVYFTKAELAEKFDIVEL